MVLIADNFNVAAPTTAVKSAADNFNVAGTVGNTPGPVTGLAATPLNAAARLTWTAPVASLITGYKVVATSTSGSRTYTVPLSSGTTIDLTGLVNAALWTFSVTVLNGGFESTAVTTTTTPTSGSAVPDGSVPILAPMVVVPDAPVLTAVTGSNSAVGAVWSAPTYDGGSPVTSYLITAFGNNQTFTQVISAPATTGTIGGLENAVAYSVTVAARNAAGTSVASNTLVATTAATGPPVDPPPPPPVDPEEPVVIASPSLVAFLPQTPFAPAYWVGVR